MTAAEWLKTPWGSTPEAKHLLDDLVACERERDKWHDEANEYKAGFWRETIRADAAEERAEDEKLHRMAAVDVLGGCKQQLAMEQAELDRLRPLAIGGDGTTHWYYRDEYERVAAECADLQRQIEDDKIFDERMKAWQKEEMDWKRERYDLRRKLADASLANAPLREALASLASIASHICAKRYDEGTVPSLVAEMAYLITQADAALAAAGEVEK